MSEFVDAVKIAGKLVKLKEHGGDPVGFRSVSPMAAEQGRMVSVFLDVSPAP